MKTTIQQFSSYRMALKLLMQFKKISDFSSYARPIYFLFFKTNLAVDLFIR